MNIPFDCGLVAVMNAVDLDGAGDHFAGLGAEPGGGVVVFFGRGFAGALDDGDAELIELVEGKVPPVVGDAESALGDLADGGIRRILEDAVDQAPARSPSSAASSWCSLCGFMPLASQMRWK